MRRRAERVAGVLLATAALAVLPMLGSACDAFFTGDCSAWELVVYVNGDDPSVESTEVLVVAADVGLACSIRTEDPDEVVLLCGDEYNLEDPCQVDLEDLEEAIDEEALDATPRCECFESA